MTISASKICIDKGEETEYNSIDDIHDYIEENEFNEMYLVDKHKKEQHFDDGLFGLLAILGTDDLDNVTDVTYIDNEFRFRLMNNKYVLGVL